MSLEDNGLALSGRKLMVVVRWVANCMVVQNINEERAKM